MGWTARISQPFSHGKNRTREGNGGRFAPRKRNSGRVSTCRRGAQGHRHTGVASDVGGKPVNSDLAPWQQLLSVAMPLCATEGTLVGLGFTHARPFGLLDLYYMHVPFVVRFHSGGFEVFLAPPFALWLPRRRCFESGSSVRLFMALVSRVHTRSL